MAREQRKLAAILAADVVGYSRLMGWPRAGRKILEPVLARYRGRGPILRRQRLGWLR